MAFVLAGGLPATWCPWQSPTSSEKPKRLMPGGHAMKRRQTDTSDAPARERGRLSRSLPVLAGAVIAAVGLTVGSLTAASAAAGHGGPPSIEQQAAKVKAQDAFTPVNGNTEMNVNVLEDQIEHYYGSASATFPVVGTVTVPSPDSNYAKQMHHIVASAESYLARGHSPAARHGQARRRVRHRRHPAQHLRLHAGRAVRLHLGQQRDLGQRRRVPGGVLHAGPGQLRGQPRLRGLLHHRPAADPDRRHG